MFCISAKEQVGNHASTVGSISIFNVTSVDFFGYY
jgi:hypothetical protein